MEQIIQQLKNSHEVLLATHSNPDGDAIGSLIAMGLALAAIGKKITLHDESPIPAVYRFLPAVSRVVRKITSVDAYDTAVILDCGDLQRIGKAALLVGRIPVTINIDHHFTNSGFGSLQYIDTAACATSEIVYTIIKRMAVPISQDMAVAIYSGILTDTGSFRFSNTNRAAFAICEEMVELGVNPYHIAQHVYGTYSLGRIKLLNLALDSIEISPNGKLSLMTVTRNMLNETKTQPEDADGLINYARRIEAVKLAVLIQEIKNNRCEPGDTLFHVSLRSDGDIDVAAIASTFGGGGHVGAAGFSIKTTLPELKSEIFELAKAI